MYWRPPMRILAIPLGRAGQAGSPPLIYFYVHLPPPNNLNPSAKPRTGLHARLEKRFDLLPGAPLPLQLTSKATSFWATFGKDVDGWYGCKHKLYRIGEALMDRIEFEEWSLKRLETGFMPPSLLDVSGVESKTSDHPPASREEPQTVPLLSPSQYEVGTVDLELFLKQRLPFHRRRFMQSLFCVPLTFPFALLPIMPNFPMFYVLWRAWSHWKARNAAQVLLKLLTANCIVAENSTNLSRIYDAERRARGGVYLSDESLHRLVLTEGLGDAGAEELQRAFDQARRRISQAGGSDLEGGAKQKNS